MSVSFSVPKEYGYVVAVASASYLFAVWHGVRVGSFRRAAQIPYPNAYASMEALAAATPEKKKAMYLFNCAQRAHANFLENYPIMLSGMLISGLKYPVASAGMGVFWLVSRVMYATGYTDPSQDSGKGRYGTAKMGSMFWLMQLGWVVLGGKMGYDMVMA